jgi:6-phosphofructokinase 2
MNPALDENSAVAHVFSDVKLRCRAPSLEPGGGGINVARAVVRLGGQALAVYAAGGPSGELLAQMLDREGVPQRVVPVRGWTRRNLNVREDSTGRQYRFVLPGPPLDETEWNACLDALRSIRPASAILVASGSLPPGVPPDFYARVAAVSAELGARFVIDVSGEPLRRALERGVFLVKVSLREFEEVTGVTGTEADLLKEARRLIDHRQCEVIVLSLGRGGALWVAAGGHERLAAPEVPVASSVGAGDAMVGGIVLSLCRGLALPEAMRFGVAAGAAAVMNPGTQLCQRGDTERLFQRMARTIA